VVEQMVKIMMVVMAMEMIKCSGLEKKKEKNKKVQGKGIFDGSFLFWHSRRQVGVSVLRIDSRTIKRGETRSKMWLSKCN
jgi:hypothetical protein